MTGHPSSVITAAVFDTKPYDRKALQQASANHGIAWHFLDFRLTQETASAARNARAVCAFVKDELNRACLEWMRRSRRRSPCRRCVGKRLSPI